MSYVIDYVLGDALKSLRATLRDSTDTPINITGYTVALQAATPDGPTFNYTALLTATGGVNTVTRASGNFTTDGVQVGQQLGGAIAGYFPLGARITAVGTTTVTMSANALVSTPSAQNGVISGHSFSVTGSLVDAVNGICKFDGIGNVPTSATMGQRPQVIYRGEVKATSGGNPTFSQLIQIRIRRPVLV